MEILAVVMTVFLSWVVLLSNNIKIFLEDLARRWTLDRPFTWCIAQMSTHIQLKSSVRWTCRSLDLRLWPWHSGLMNHVFMCLSDGGALIPQLRPRSSHFAEQFKGKSVLFHTSITFMAHGSEGLHWEHLVLNTVAKVTFLTLHAAGILVGN